MKLAKVLGPVVATRHHPAWDGLTLLAVQPLNEVGVPEGEAILAVDHTQAGEGDVVLVLREGSGVRQLLKRPEAPIRSLIVGIVDQVSVDSELGADKLGSQKSP